jgi:hypothetical protein
MALKRIAGFLVMGRRLQHQRAYARQCTKLPQDGGAKADHPVVTHANLPQRTRLPDEKEVLLAEFKVADRIVDRDPFSDVTGRNVTS